jgi:hypothetical protein
LGNIIENLRNIFEERLGTYGNKKKFKKSILAPTPTALPPKEKR